ncbi:unnamed protein product [Microthlaspi erraticum]|uniref:KIB1-4 beta-propeller domain-containing protein n=1 Tax=Microthlaspi erraticum TaxID=1685480 RepID=A0A6D2IZ65_9BRAS|nr:unnamed protein product [Microthlaspi erraticum]
MLGRIVKLSSSARNPGLCLVHEQRLFSTAATPYMLLRSSNAVEERLVSIDCFDPRKQETVKIPVPEEMQESVTIGSSRGWVCLRNIHDSSVRLTNIFNPAAKVVSLPPLPPANVVKVSNMALSASPDDERCDCVVAVKFLAATIGLCRPGDSGWTYIQTPEVPAEKSNVMYSVTDQKFYLNTCHSLSTTSSIFPPVSPYPRFHSKENVGLLSLSCRAMPYLVETPSGQPLLVFWFKEKSGSDPEKSESSFLVHDLRKSRHTRDIGDLCIFLGDKNEAFCVSATDYPGLHPNSVYFGSSDSGLGFFDLASQTLHHLTDSTTPDSMWLAPLH